MDTRTPLIVLEFSDNSDPDAAPEAPEFVLPEDLSALSAEFDEDGTLTGGELFDLHADAVAAFDAVREGALDADALQILSDLTSAIEALRGEVDARVTAATEAREAAEELAARVHGEAPEGAEDAVEATEGGDTPEAPEGAADGDVELSADDQEEAAAESEAVEPETVTAAARPSRIRLPLGAIRAAQRPADEPGASDGQFAITAAADLPGVTPGTRFGDLDAVGRAAHGRARRLNDGGSAPIATIETSFDVTLSEGMTRNAMREAITAATNPASLVAAGGWCAPSQIRWDFFNVAEQDGLWDAPEVGIDRGGIEYILNGGPSIADVIGTDAIWTWTEAQDIEAADNPHDEPGDDEFKPIGRIPCPSWAEARLAMHGIAVEHGNLADMAFPENTDNYLRLVLAAHAHTLNGRRLAAAESGSTAVTMGASAFGATTNLLAAVELQVADLADKYRMGLGAVAEVVLPHWARGLIRSDLARRGGIDTLAVTDAAIEAHFAARRGRVQWVYDWQALQTGPNTVGTPDGVAEAYPATTKFLVYPAGTWLLGRGPRLDLGVMRDSAQVAVNDHTAAWTEEAWLQARVGHESRVVTVPTVPSGALHGGLEDTDAGAIGY